MVDPRIAESFINSALPGDLRAESVEVLSNALNPLASIDKASRFIHRDSTRKMIDILKAHADAKKDFRLTLVGGGGATEGGSKFIKEFLESDDALTEALPDQDYDAQADYICRLSTGEIVNVEVQVIPQNYFVPRLLYYASLIYAHQMKKGGSYKDINRVIAISLLGGGHKPEVWTTSYTYWELKDQHGNSFSKGIELIQFPLFAESIQEHKKVISDEKKISYGEWMKFWEHGYTEDMIEKIQTPEIKLALDATDLDKHQGLKKDIEEDKRRLELVSDYVAQQVKETAERVKHEMKEKEKHADEERAKGLIATGSLTDLQILAACKTLTQERLDELKRETGS